LSWAGVYSVALLALAHVLNPELKAEDDVPQKENHEPDFDNADHRIGTHEVRKHIEIFTAVVVEICALM
jgi:hypothetical protein